MFSTSLYYTPMVPPFLWAIGLVLLTIYVRKSRNLPLPPGPPRFLIIGSVHLIPRERVWLTYNDWRKQYGDIIYFSAMGKEMIILNSPKAVIDLLDRRGAIYADRPYLHMTEMIGWKDTLGLCRYGNFFRESRKLMSAYLGPRKVAEELHPMLEEKILIHLLRPLLNSPSRFMEHIRNSVAATVVYVAYGHLVTDSDPLVDLAREATSHFAIASSPGAFLVEIFPLLRYVPEWFPAAGFKRKAKKWRLAAVRLRDDEYFNVKAQVRKGVAHPSFAEELIKNNGSPSAEQEHLYKWTAASFYAGGADTTVSSISSFFLAMILHPEVQKKAYEEVEHVTRGTRLPTFADRENMPYLEALVKEIWRWNPVAPLAVPHRLMENDEYAGYRIPKGCIVIPNSWAILHDPSLYPSPFEFLPERFLSQSSNIMKDVDNSDRFSQNPDPSKFAFGYGRRVCPGQFLANSTVWIIAAMLLATYDISPSLGVDGEVEMPEVEYMSGIISHPKEFKCRITPRSNAVKILISGTEHI